MQAARILVVEDEVLIRTLMVEVLAEAGFDVDDVGDSDGAVRLLDKDGYHLLVTDMHMPGKLNGLEVAQRAQRDTPKMPVVFVTGQHAFLDRFRQTGIPGVALPKPFDFDHLVRVVQRLVEPAVDTKQ